MNKPSRCTKDCFHIMDAGGKYFRAPGEGSTIYKADAFPYNRDDTNRIIQNGQYLLSIPVEDEDKGMNPKDIIGATKAPLGFVPPVAVLQMARAMAVGAGKYGPFNWREFPVQSMTYLEAGLRHIYQAIDGEWYDPDTITPENPEGVPHIAMAMAGLGILLDARSLGKMKDNRPLFAGKFSELAGKFYPKKK